ncbi:putative FYVE zinc finger, Zinc finger, FYVE/PHD-type, Zinc finger, RING/FYVE/PHD-type [Plasmopara halstedii]
MAIRHEVKRASAVEVNTQREIYQEDKQQEEEQIRWARRRFASEEDENLPTTLALTLPPKIMMNKSESRFNVLSSGRSRHLLLSAKTATQVETMYDCNGASFESNRNIDLLSSVSSNEAAAGATKALEQGLISSQMFSTSAFVPDDVLVAIIQRAKKQLEAVSERREEVGRWKKLARSKPNCKVYESLSKMKDQFSVMVVMNLPCTLREIVSVFSTSNDAEFHRSMEAVFGDQYVYGVNVRSVDCVLRTEESGVTSRVGRARDNSRASELSSRISADLMTDCNPSHQFAKLNLNAVSLMQKHRLVWKQRNLTFLDYLDETIETKSFTRVMQTLDVQEEELDTSSVTMSSSTCASNCEEHYSPFQIQNGDDIRQELRGIFAGYVIKENSDAKLTRVFFYSTHQLRSTKQPHSAAQLLRGMVAKVCLLEAVVLRRRLGFYPISPFPVSQDEATLSSYCATCYTPFKMLRRKYFCRLCAHYTCRKCSNVHDVEKSVGLVEKHRVCVSCVRRVSYSVFSMNDFPPSVSSNFSGDRWASTRSQNSIEFDGLDPPIIDLIPEDIENIKPVDTNQTGVLATFADLLRRKDKKQEPRKQEVNTQRKQRPQLTLDDLNSWIPGSHQEGRNTPKESISLLDSFSTSYSSASSRTRDFAFRLSSSPTGASE